VHFVLTKLCDVFKKRAERNSARPNKISSIQKISFLTTLQVKVPREFVSVHGTKAYVDSGGTARLILKLGATWGR
jgi:hypothetical protein